MCVILHKQAGKAVAEADIIGAMETNPHGFGFMFLNPETKRIEARKGLFKKPKTVIKVFKDLTPFEACFHFRIRTHGAISDSACHPFMICDKEKHGIDMYMMHNGTFGKVHGKVGESDTQQFVNNYLQPMLQNNPMFIETDAFKELVESYIGNYNKVIFMYGDEGKVLRLNDANWGIHDGMNVSNKFFVPTTTWHSHGRRGSSRFSASDNYDAEDYVVSCYDGPTRSWNRGDAIAALKRKRDQEKDNKVRYFCGSPIKLGTSMYMTHQTSEHWYATGIVTELNEFNCKIDFPGMNGVKRTSTFYLHHGTPDHTATGYQAVPLSRPVDTVSKTIHSIMEEKKKKTEAALKEEKAEEEALKIAVQEKPPEPTTAPVQLQLVDQTKKKETEAEKVNSERNLSEVSHKGITIECKHRWCAFFKNSTQDFVDGTTVNDIFHKTDQERFRWFMDNTETAYNMFLDLMEKVVYDDQESGILDENFFPIVEDVDPTEDAVEETQEQKDERVLAEMEKMWNGWGCGG